MNLKQKLKIYFAFNERNGFFLFYLFCIYAAVLTLV